MTYDLSDISGASSEYQMGLSIWKAPNMQGLKYAFANDMWISLCC